jgi:hypothetical protein
MSLPIEAIRISRCKCMMTVFIGADSELHSRYRHACTSLTTPNNLGAMFPQFHCSLQASGSRQGSLPETRAGPCHRQEKPETSKSRVPCSTPGKHCGAYSRTLPLGARTVPGDGTRSFMQANHRPQLYRQLTVASASHTFATVPPAPAGTHRPLTAWYGRPPGATSRRRPGRSFRSSPARLRLLTGSLIWAPVQIQPRLGYLWTAD